ncbi:UDP-glucosyltransferase 2-like isoform X2 [Plodia interpunctella]|nr:UDP-glucosyltransferase 2-like isoform X2 [Plodia interpunctella]XP_053615385.1 UDP-glucosyltransferase 2-like isoform X2 [Plodia interpunctella]XP_053615386.1 UDP-glucosyltransferase 2-like isoform X2 [Plodia interpunctella]
MTNVAYILVAALAVGHVCDAYRILVVFPLAGKSHNILALGVVKALLQAGHEVTQITAFPDKNPIPNLRQIDISGSVDTKHLSKIMNVTSILDGRVQMGFSSMKAFIEMMNKGLLTDPNLVNFLSDTTQKFDVIVAEWMFTDVYIGFSYVYDCPFIWLSTIEPHWIILSLIDENVNPAYVPDSLSNNVPPFNFANRVKELALQTMGRAFRFFYLDGYQNEQFQKLIGPYFLKRGKSMIHFKAIQYNASLVLGNSHVSLGQATRLPQAYKPIAGYHIDPVVKPLPEDLKKLLDNAKNGLIYFSLGSNLKSKDLPQILKKDLLEMLGGLKQTVLWKFEEVLPNLPSNIHIVNWAPQQSILAHPNCILFITHGGLLSTTEAVHFGKPIIGIPVFGDQFNNIDRAVRKGFALRVDLAYDMKDHLRAAIDDALHNKRYAEKAKELSLIYHDRPVPPSKELVHWVEHVVKTRGAPHLRSPALDVPVYQKLYLDLVALILTVLYVLKKIFVKICCSKKNIDRKKKKN